MTKRISAVATGVIGLIAGFATGACAQTGPPPGPPPGGPRPMMGAILPPGIAMPLPPGLWSVALSSAQQDRIRQEMDTFRQSSEPTMRQLRAALDDQRTVTQTSSFDSSRAQALAQREVDLADALAVGAQAVQSEIMTSVLTANQRSELATGGSQHPPAPRNPPSPVDMASRMADQLGLTAHQQSEIEAALASQQPQMEADRAKLRRIWGAYRQSAVGSAGQSAALRSALDASKPVEIDFAVLNMKTREAIWTSLTADQRTQLGSMRPPQGPGGGFGGPPPNGGFSGPPLGGGFGGPSPGGGFGAPPPDGGFGGPPPDGGFGGPPPDGVGM